jgi:four helix bundle protein
VVVGGGFEELVAYRRSATLADELRAVVGQWPSLDLWTVGIQLVRAADSVGANIAEAYGRRTDADRTRLLFIARGSTCELEHWLMRAEARGLPCPSAATERAREVGRMLNGLASSWRP